MFSVEKAWLLSKRDDIKETVVCHLGFGGRGMAMSDEKKSTPAPMALTQASPDDHIF